jgi:hypothetical protein
MDIFYCYPPLLPNLLDLHHLHPSVSELMNTKNKHAVWQNDGFGAFLEANVFKQSSAILH